MVNVIAVIFFGKSEKNIWVFDFFKYNHKYETVKQQNRFIHGTVSQSNSRAVHNRFIRGTDTTVTTVQQSQQDKQSLQFGTVSQL